MVWRCFGGRGETLKLKQTLLRLYPLTDCGDEWRIIWTSADICIFAFYYDKACFHFEHWHLWHDGGSGFNTKLCNFGQWVLCRPKRNTVRIHILLALRAKSSVAWWLSSKRKKTHTGDRWATCQTNSPIDNVVPGPDRSWSGRTDWLHHHDDSPVNVWRACSIVRVHVVKEVPH